MSLEIKAIKTYKKVIPMKKIFQAWLPSLAIICFLGPIVGTFIMSLFWGQPEIVISSDIAGGPMLIYAYITVWPIMVPTSILWCYILELTINREEKKIVFKNQNKSFFILSLKLGVFFGFWFSVLLVLSAFFSGELLAAMQWAIAGISTGIVCSLLCFPIWKKQLDLIEIK